MTKTVENPSRRRLFRGRLAQQPPSLRLPWIKSESIFVEHCSQCNDCVSTCESKIIKSDDLGFPTIDFSKDECTFCGKCQDVCQQPLFIDKAVVKAENIQPWPATLEISNKCLAKNSILCQSCQDVCDTNAISFSYQSSSIPEPSVNLTDCNQCGACISTCPQQAITLNIHHQLEIAHA
ncbi:ferredoxin-type protein NapF [Colwelliaceae bacterium 6441]